VLSLLFTRSSPICIFAGQIVDGETKDMLTETETHTYPLGPLLWQQLDPVKRMATLNKSQSDTPAVTIRPPALYPSNRSEVSSAILSAT
jgi:hypothetical protein